MPLRIRWWWMPPPPSTRCVVLANLLPRRLKSKHSQEIKKLHYTFTHEKNIWLCRGTMCSLCTSYMMGTVRGKLQRFLPIGDLDTCGHCCHLYHKALPSPSNPLTLRTYSLKSLSGNANSNFLGLESNFFSTNLAKNFPVLVSWIPSLCFFANPTTVLREVGSSWRDTR